MLQFLRRFWRSIKSDPWYAASTVLTLGLGIGISTSAFTVLDRLVLRNPPGVRAPRALQRIATIDQPTPTQPNAAERNYLSYPELQAIAQGTTGLGDLTSYWTWPNKVPVRLNSEVMTVRALGVSTNYFAVLGVTPSLGRSFSVPAALVAPQGGPAEVIISDAFWTRALGRNPGALGATVSLHSVSLKVIGIAPAGFDGILLDGPDMWIPAEFVGLESFGPEWKVDRKGMVWAAVIRKLPVARDADIRQRIQVALQADAEGLEPRRTIGPTVLVSLRRALASEFGPQIRLALALWAVSLVVLVTTAINAGSLFLMHGFEQQRNIAIALAVGGKRSRIVTGRIAEGLVLAFAGGVFGLLLSKAGSVIVRMTLASYIHYTEPMLDYRLFGYALLLALLVGGFASALPALRATRVDLKALLDEGGLGGGKEVRKLTTLIHCVQLAFAVIVLYGAALFVQSGRRARGVSLGVDIDHVVVSTALLAQEDSSEAHIQQYWERVTAELKGAPGIESMALSQTLPFHNMRDGLVFTTDGPPGGQPAAWSSIGVGYPTVLRMHLLAGRELSGSDVAESEPVAMINRTGASRLWGGQSALGKCVNDVQAKPRCVRIVGVVEDSKRMELDEPAAIEVFYPLAQRAHFPLTPMFIVRPLPGAQSQVLNLVRSVLTKQAPEGIPISVSPMSDAVDDLVGQWVRSARLLSLFALLSGLVTFVGIYGSTAYDLLRRRREIGIRLALGALPSQLTRGVVSTGLRWAVYGLAIGSVGAIWMAETVRALLFGTTPLDLGSLAASVVVVLAIGSLAAWLGARRAAVKDPVFLLRNSR